MPETTPDVPQRLPEPRPRQPRVSGDVPAAASVSASASRPHRDVVGDDALAAATGRSRTDWYALLDAAGAGDWRHRDIAAWLAAEHGVDAWWSQGITVGYEQARGIRVPGQRQDGSFECSVSRTLPVGVDRAWALVAEAASRNRWLGTEVSVMGETAPASVRWGLPDATRAVVRVEPVRAGATRVVVQHGRLPDAGALAASKAAWKERLATLSRLAGDPDGH